MKNSAKEFKLFVDFKAEAITFPQSGKAADSTCHLKTRILTKWNNPIVSQTRKLHIVLRIQHTVRQLSTSQQQQLINQISVERDENDYVWHVCGKFSAMQMLLNPLNQIII